MRKITVTGENGYEILIDSGIVSSAGEYVRRVSSARKVMIVSDTNVMPLYGATVEKSLRASGFEVYSCVFSAGEQFKTLDTVSDMIKAFCEAQLTRSDIVVALGGGVTGDMAGFASAIYLRGIDFVQIPTTLLSQVDSSVGGKTGCDLSFGKNLVGAFHNPKLVLIDPETLNTLPERYKKDGMGEIIKYGAIRSADLFEKLEKCVSFEEIQEEVIYRCVDIKRQVVENDFTEKGTAHRIIALLKKFGLPTQTEAPTEALCDIMLHDKKRRGNTLNIVLLKKIGDSFTLPYPTDKLKQFFSEGK